MKITKLIVLTILTFGLTVKVNSQTNDSNNKPILYTDNSIGGNFFIGNGIYNGNISEYFSNPFYVGINLGYYKNRIAIQFNDYIGFGKTKDVIEYSTQEIWDENDFVLSGMIDLSLGYSLIDNDDIMIVPLSGIGFNKLSANLDELYDFGNKFKPIIPHIKFGCYVDLRIWRFFKNNPSFNINDGSYSCASLTFGYTIPISQTDYYEYYNGNQFYITLGFGGLGKIK
tara:strand:+ start:92 stop:772 length:681 start_codon:yes stop_codon:yes gene_type:complete